jgi:hypothetical protein
LKLSGIPKIQNYIGRNTIFKITFEAADFAGNEIMRC